MLQSCARQIISGSNGRIHCCKFRLEEKASMTDAQLVTGATIAHARSEGKTRKELILLLRTHKKRLVQKQSSIQLVPCGIVPAWAMLKGHIRDMRTASWLCPLYQWISKAMVSVDTVSMDTGRKHHDWTVQSRLGCPVQDRTCLGAHCEIMTRNVMDRLSV